MASFDVIEAAGKGYYTIWTERSYLVRLALIPVMVKIFCYVGVVALGWTENYIRQALVMLPAYFTEGWLLSHLVRLIFFDQRWPFRSTGDAEKDIVLMQDRSTGIMGGMVFYALIQLVLAGLYSIFMSTGGADVQQVTPGQGTEIPTSLPVFIASLALLVTLFWAFRFLWLFIPAAVNYPVRRFIKDIEGFSSSLFMVGTWLICALPLMFLLVLIASQLLGPYGNDVTQIPTGVEFSVGVTRIVFDTLLAMICTAGMTHGLYSVMVKKRPSVTKTDKRQGPD